MIGRMSAAPVALALAALTGACVENTAPGNDREASLEEPAPAAELATASAALQGVATGLLYPQIMTDADLGNAPGPGDPCVFRYTRVGFPVLVYGATTAVIKLNGWLVPLPAAGDGRYTDGGVTVTVRPLDDAEEDEPFLTELVLRLQDAPNELGFHGFSEC